MKNHFAVTSLLALLAMFGPFAIDAYLPAFEHMRADMNLSQEQLQQTLSVCLLAGAAAAMFHGPLSDALGRRRVILWMVLGFAGSSIFCAVATDYTMLLLGRALQGATTGAGIIIGRAIIRDKFSAVEAHSILAHVTLLFSVAPALAPLLGGYLTSITDGWRAVFWMLSGLGAITCFMIFFFLDETHPVEARIEFSPGSLMRSYWSVLSSPSFGLVSLALAANFAGFFLYVVSSPALILKFFKLGEMGFSYFFVPAVAGMMLGAWVSARMAALPRRGIIATGYAVMLSAAGTGFVLNSFLPDAMAVLLISPIVIYNIGVQIAAPALTLTALDLFPERKGSASSVASFIGTLFAAATAGIFSMIFSSSPVTLALGSILFCVFGLVCYLAFDLSTRVSASPKMI